MPMRTQITRRRNFECSIFLFPYIHALILLTSFKLMFDLPYFVSDSSYGYQSDLHDDNFVRRKQRRNRTTFTVQQVKLKKENIFYLIEHFVSLHLLPIQEISVLTPFFILHLSRILQSAESLEIVFSGVATWRSERR